MKRIFFTSPFSFVGILLFSLSAHASPAKLFSCSASGIKLDVEVLEREYTPGVPSCYGGVVRIDTLSWLSGQMTYSTTSSAGGTQCNKSSHGYDFYFQGSNTPHNWWLSIATQGASTRATGSDLPSGGIACKVYLQQ